MRNRLATLGFVVLTALGLSAQNTALQFDGVDDFAFVTVNQPPTAISQESYTFEAIFKGAPTGQDAVLLSVPQASGNLLFGIDHHGSPFLQHRDNVYTTEEPQNLLDEQCHHMAITVFDMMVKFYVDGNFVGYNQLYTLPPFTNQTNWYLGMDYPDQSTAFTGVLDEVRFWPEARTDGEIMTYAMKTLPLTLPRFLLIPFIEGSGIYAYDPFVRPDNYVNWLPNDGPNMQWVQSCLEEMTGYGERLGGGAEPPCISPANPLNMICNGEFEQFHPILTSPQFSTFPGIFQNGQPLVASSGVSDIVRWRAGQISPDIWIRGGIGGVPVNLQNPPTAINTHDWPNVSNNAMTGLTSYNGNFGESLITKLITPALAGVTYAFSGWFYTEQRNMLLTDYFDHELQLILRNSITNQTFVINPNVVTLNHTEVGGWHQKGIQFSIPCTPYVEYDELIIKALPNANLANMYTLLDDLELVPNQISQNFPQTVSLTPKSGTLPAGNYTDYNGQTYNANNAVPYSKENHHHANRFVETDAQGNTYVAAYVNFQSGGSPWVAQYNPTITYNSTPAQNRQLDGWAGVLLSKYNTCGELQWQHTIHNRANTTLAGMAVSTTGDVYVLGDAENIGTLSSGQYLRTTAPGSPTGSLASGKRVYMAKFSSQGSCNWIKETPVNPNKYAVDLEISTSGVFAIVNELYKKLSRQTFQLVTISNYEVLNFSTPSTPSVLASRAGKLALKSTLFSSELIVAEAELGSTDNIYLRKYAGVSYNILVSTSLAITQNNGNGLGSYGFPLETVSDMQCDGNGHIILLGNFSNGISFTGGIPTNNTNSVFQDYQNAGIGITGFIAKYDNNLSYLTSDFLRPEVVSGQMIQVLGSLTVSCQPPTTSCDVLNTAVTSTCPGGLTYFCYDLVWVNQGSVAPHIGLFANLYQDMSIDNDNNILISGIVGSADWGNGQLITSNNQPFVCKYDGTLSRSWINVTSGNIGIENQLNGHTTGIAFEPLNGQHRVVGNFIGSTKVFDYAMISTATNNEHIFVTNLVDVGNASVYKNDLASDKLEQSDYFKVFPNPASDIVTIRSEAKEIYSYTMFTSHNKIIATGKSDGFDVMLNIEGLAAGVYYIQFEGTNNGVVRFVINR